MSMDYKNYSFISNEDIGEIAGASDFSGFLKASDINKALETNPSLNLSMILEDESSGDTNQPTEVELRSQEQVDEPQANSTLLEPVEEPVEPAEDGETGTETGKVGSEPTDSKERKRIKRRLARQRRALTEKLSKLSTDPNGQGIQGTEASGSRTEEAGPSNPQPSGSADSNAEKRGRSSPGENPGAKRARQEDTRPGPLSFLEATRKDIVLSITPLDPEGNIIRATASDKVFIIEKIEHYIASKNPNINIKEFSLRGNTLKMRCLNQKTLEVVKRLVSPLKGPRSNLQGYQCLGPEDRPPLTTYGVWVEKPIPSKDQLIGLLRDANDWLNPRKLVVKATIPKEKGTTFLIGVEPEIKAELERQNFKLHYGVGRTAHFRVKPKGQQRGEREAP